MHFVMNDVVWTVVYVPPDDSRLIDRLGRLTLGTTDPVSHVVCLSNTLDGQMLRRVLVHEIAHCTIVSYDLLPIIHSHVHPDNWIKAEEAVCNFIADYGDEIFQNARFLLE